MMRDIPHFGLLDRSDLRAIFDLGSRSLPDPPSEEELARALFAPEQPALVRGDPDAGLVATVRGVGGENDQLGFIRLLMVDPAHRGHGLGRALLAAAEADLAGTRSITVGADAPYYLYPGVPVEATAMLCLLERCRYPRAEANFNMDVDLGALPDDPGGAVPATGADRAEVDQWTATHWPNWRLEVLRALDQGSLAISRDGQGIAAFCAWDVNRRGLLGPVAVRLDLLGQGAGVPVLLHGLHRMRAGGLARAEVAWVGPVVPYARVGGTVGRVFFVYRKVLSASQAP
jgi:GNAT superfamily N-acetyltransferase